ncbi:MAG TPA: hypothetical protein VH593_19135, partial [Ktedonobacteraceae bacterium]
FSGILQEGTRSSIPFDGRYSVEILHRPLQVGSSRASARKYCPLVKQFLKLEKHRRRMNVLVELFSTHEMLLHANQIHLHDIQQHDVVCGEKTDKEEYTLVTLWR